MIWQQAPYLRKLDLHALAERDAESLVGVADDDELVPRLHFQTHLRR